MYLHFVFLIAGNIIWNAYKIVLMLHNLIISKDYYSLSVALPTSLFTIRSVELQCVTVGERACHMMLTFRELVRLTALRAVV